MAAIENTVNHAVPSRYPRLNVRSSGYWSASTRADNPSLAWFVDFLNGNVLSSTKSLTTLVWCVRGGMHGGVRLGVDRLPVCV